MRQPLNLLKVIQRFFIIAAKLVANHRLKLLALFFGVFIPFFIFGHLAEDVWDEGGFGWDIPVLLAIHKWATPTLDALMINITNLGGPQALVPIVVVILGLLLLQQKYFQALFFCLATAGAAVINIAAKLFFRRARPDLWISAVIEHNYGFPSGHAMGSMAVITAVVIMTWSTRWRWFVIVCGYLFVLLVGLSRLYFGVHFPSDVLAGWSASLCWVVGLYMVLSSRFKQLLRRFNKPQHE